MIPNNNAGQFEGLEHLNLSNPEVDEAAAAAHLAQQQEQYTESLPTAMQEGQAKEQQEAEREEQLTTRSAEVADKFTATNDERELLEKDLFEPITKGIDNLSGIVQLLGRLGNV